jgi:hypothetical protein
LTIERVLTVPNKKDIYNLILSGTTKTPLHSEQEIYDYINSIDIHTFLGINEGEMINCILPDHKDNTPSAHIYTTDSGTQVYKCFGCDKARTIIGLVEELAHCKRHDAINFIKKVYNIELVQSDWVKEQKELMIESANYLDTECFLQALFGQNCKTFLDIVACPNWTKLQCLGWQQTYQLRAIADII